MSRMFNLKELLEGKQSVALGGHVRPDGDCVGSTMGLYLYLKENFPQIETDLYLESVPEAYSMIRHTDEVKSELPEGCRPHGSTALHQVPPNLHGALFGVTFHRTCPPNRFFNGMRRAVGLCGQCWRAGRRHGTIRSEQIFFSNAETLCPPGSLSRCKALQKQTKENAPCAASKLLSWIKTGDKTGPRPTA